MRERPRFHFSLAFEPRAGGRWIESGIILLIWKTRKHLSQNLSAPRRRQDCVQPSGPLFPSGEAAARAGRAADGRRQCTSAGLSPTAWRTGKMDPWSPFTANGGKARESGLGSGSGLPKDGSLEDGSSTSQFPAMGDVGGSPRKWPPKPLPAARAGRGGTRRNVPLGKARGRRSAPLPSS